MSNKCCQLRRCREISRVWLGQKNSCTQIQGVSKTLCCGPSQLAVRGGGREEGLTLRGALGEVRKIISVPTFLIIILQVSTRLPTVMLLTKCKRTVHGAICTLIVPSANGGPQCPS